ncbi:MAG TPA: ABC transporter permease [Acidimicrobiales bacterium]|nr:ABC transporter permease [Acidimicrobiales bacterium]
MLLASQPWVQWSWVRTHLHVIRHEVWQHLLLTLLAVGIGLLITFPLALLARAWRPLEGPLIALTGTLYAVPSLALFAVLVPFTGFTTTSAEIGLVGYTLLILLRNMLAGLDAVPDDVRDAALGMGFGRWRMFTRVELPLALPALFAGIRIATVTTIGLVTVTVFIGEGGLGAMLFQGFQNTFRTQEVVGAVLVVALAVAADVVLVGVQRVLTPWARGRA